MENGSLAQSRPAVGPGTKFRNFAQFSSGFRTRPSSAEAVYLPHYETPFAASALQLLAGSAGPHLLGGAHGAAAYLPAKRPAYDGGSIQPQAARLPAPQGNSARLSPDQQGPTDEGLLRVWGPLSQVGCTFGGAELGESPAAGCAAPMAHQPGVAGRARGSDNGSAGLARVGLLAPAAGGSATAHVCECAGRLAFF
jgi:hypothetical protein